MRQEETLRKEGESELEYVWRMGELKTSGRWDVDWEEWAKVVDAQCRVAGEPGRSSATYRKPYQCAKQFYETVFSKQGDTSYAEQLNQTKVELEKERMRLRDERTQYQRYIREEARLEHRLEHLERCIREKGQCWSPEVRFKQVDCNSQNEMLVLPSDWHIGLQFDNEFGKFDTDIAAERINELLSRIIEYKEKHGCRVCNVGILGDMISGFIHTSIQVSNRENVIEQIQIVSELLGKFLKTLCELFDDVHCVSVAGNHSRLDPNKDKAMKNERLDDLIAWYVKNFLSHCNNFHMYDNLDNSIAEMAICGKTYFFVHGDYDVTDQNGISKLIFMMNCIPYAVCVGHKHTPMFGEVSGVKIIQSGALSGSGDDYTVTKRLVGSPSQTIAICNEDGIECFYPVILDA